MYTIRIPIVKQLDVKSFKLFVLFFYKRVRNIFCVEEEAPLQTKIQPKIILLVIPKINFVWLLNFLTAVEKKIPYRFV